MSEYESHIFTVRSADADTVVNSYPSGENDT